MKEQISIIFLVLVGAINISAQTLTPEQIAKQRLGKALDALAATEAERDAYKAESGKKDDLIAKILDQNAKLMEQNALLLAQNRDLSRLKCSDFAFIDLHIIKIGHIKRCK